MYDITKKYRETAHRLYSVDVGRVKDGLRPENSLPVSDNIIFDNDENVKHSVSHAGHNGRNEGDLHSGEQQALSQ